MKSFFKLLFIAVLGGAAACSHHRPPVLPKTVENLDTARFMGMWYEIARLPFAPQRDCAASAARYERFNDESFGIVNYCWHKSINGPMRKTRAAAYIDTEDAAAKLKVQLNWPAWRDLWILVVSDDYTYALLGTPDRKNLWLLSRTPKLDHEDQLVLVDAAKREGFDTSRLIFDAVPAGDPAEPSKAEK